MIHISIDTEKCTGCGECVRLCPKGPRIFCIKAGKKTAEVIDESFCLGCTNCVAVCKPGAIRLERER